jgi:hypothetical protein
MTKIAGSGSESGYGSISQRQGSADPDPDPLQNVMDLQHCKEEVNNLMFGLFMKTTIVFPSEFIILFDVRSS